MILFDRYPLRLLSESRAVISHKKNPPVDRDDHARARACLFSFLKIYSSTLDDARRVTSREKSKVFRVGEERSLRGYYSDSHEARIADKRRKRRSVISRCNDEIVETTISDDRTIGEEGRFREIFSLSLDLVSVLFSRIESFEAWRKKEKRREMERERKRASDRYFFHVWWKTGKEIGRENERGSSGQARGRRKGPF